MRISYNNFIQENKKSVRLYNLSVLLIYRPKVRLRDKFLLELDNTLITLFREAVATVSVPDVSFFLLLNR